MKKKAVMLFAAILVLSSARIQEVSAQEIQLSDTGSAVGETDENSDGLGLEETATSFYEEEPALPEEDGDEQSPPKADGAEDRAASAAGYSESGTENLDLSEEVVQFGGYPKAHSADDADIASWASGSNIKGSIEAAIAKGKTVLDVDAYDIDTETVKRSIVSVINDHPDFFNIEGVGVDTNDEDGTVSAVRFSYVPNGDGREEKYEKEVKKILSGIKKGWSDEAKLTYLHDYLVTHCQYDLTYSRYTAYDAIVEHSAVCQGYALAYTDLVRKAGISAYLVTSWANNHAWNLVKLGGKRYYVDCTWDDPTASRGDKGCHWYRLHCGHSNFLCSQSAMAKTGHMGSDWTCDGDNIYGDYDNKAYDDSPVKKAFYSPVIFTAKGKEIFIGEATSYSGYSVYEYDTEKKKARELDGDYGYMSSSAIVGDDIYVNTKDKIYRLDMTSGAWQFVYALSDSEKSKGDIYGIVGEGTKLRYDLASGYTDLDFIKAGYVKIGKEDSVKSLTLDRTSIELDIGGKATLKANVVPSTATVRWGSSDTNVATVKDGVVTAVNKGEAVIYASAGDKNAECTVTVGPAIHLNMKSLTLYPGETVKLTATVVNPGEDVYNGFWWYSWNREVATVDQDGTVHAISPGATGIWVGGYETSTECAVTVKDNKPDKPGNVTAVNTVKGTKVTWNAVYGASGYYVSRKQGNSGYETIATVTTTSYVDNTATVNGKLYTYRIRAFRTANGQKYDGAASSVARVCRLKQVTIKNVKNKSARSLTVTWKKNSKCAGYQIQYGTDKKFKGAKTVSIKKRSTTSKKIKNLKKNRKYYVRIRPYTTVKGKKCYGAWKKFSKSVKIKK